ncbi:TPA: hypothetical protein KOO82_003484 [Clostridioides difficile]|uniref:hypothetical protein n=1 Tax=Clostridioides difficile TaxID=1496 RepID=UPI0010B4041A|nr:hypothetical protein [Clostridioides difficile]MCP8652577.1 hypothetical protein [Clostridioides difficile]MDM0194109.1 hypothetical protein [Clostridioides difficile]MDN9274932.1 hypothetical protein [Clostridioides difficile]VIB64979.1 Uncharacterised protein [Clostridioides difficile]HBE9530596.1 hypothetical protein [Clostridioides difficile]
MDVEILGTKYTILKNCTKEKEPLMVKFDGFMDDTVNKIIIAKMEHSDESLEDLNFYEKQVLRHEVIHAFLSESGLKGNSDLARNEEMVDYFAIQFPKMLKVFMELDAL